MANRKKRLEREAALLKKELQIKARLKNNKIGKQVTLRPSIDLMLTAKTVEDLKSMDLFRSFGQVFILNRRLWKRQRRRYRLMLKILSHPKLLFSTPLPYAQIGKVLITLPALRSIDTWRLPKSKDESVIFRSLFYHLFVQYKIPGCIDTQIIKFGKNTCNDLSEEVLFGIVAGTGIHRLGIISKLSLNGKMNFFFNHSPSNYSVSQSVWYAKLRSMKLSYVHTVKIINALAVQPFHEWESWHDDMVFFINRNKDVSTSDLNQILDFYIRQKVGGFNYTLADGSNIFIEALYPKFSFKGRTVASVLKYVNKWKEYTRLQLEAGKSGHFKISDVKPYRKVGKKNVYYIRQIKTLAELVREGKRMNHCVATYASECFLQSSTIWSLREFLPSGKFKHMVTIEMVNDNNGDMNGVIEMVSGKNNRNPHEFEKVMIIDWADQMGLSYRDSAFC